MEMSGPGRASPPKKTSVPHGSGSTPDNRSSPAASIPSQPSAAKDEIQTRAELEVKRSNEFGGESVTYLFMNCSKSLISGIECR